MLRFFRYVGTFFVFLVSALTVLVGVMVFSATTWWLALFNDRVVLPNGMILKREFDFSRYGHDDMFASDGETLLARDIEGICFNDLYVEVWAYDRKYNALYDGKTDSRVPYEISNQAYATSGLSGGHGCNGYYTGMVGPGLLYDGLHAPFLPPCAWRNLDNPTLKDRSWFDRPCDDGWLERFGLDPGDR